MSVRRKQAICDLLKGIETGDPASVAVVNQDKYIQHNPQTHEGGEGLAALFKRLSLSSPRVNVVRIFSDGDFVFGHTEYDFDTSRVGFEIFRFEGDQTVEHWDNIQPRRGPGPSGHSMVDGPTEARDLDRSEVNRQLIARFLDEVLINGRLEQLQDYVSENEFTEHNPGIADGLPALAAALAEPDPQGGRRIDYRQRHRVLAEGNFVLSVCEGYFDDTHCSFFDLFRLDGGRVVEHWDTTEAIPPRSEWKNQNGKF